MRDVNMSVPSCQDTHVVFLRIVRSAGLCEANFRSRRGNGGAELGSEERRLRRRLACGALRRTRPAARARARRPAAAGVGPAGAVEGEDVVDEVRGQDPQLRRPPLQDLAGDPGGDAADDHLVDLGRQARFGRPLRGRLRAAGRRSAAATRGSGGRSPRPPTGASTKSRRAMSGSAASSVERRRQRAVSTRSSTEAPSSQGCVEDLEQPLVAGLVGGRRSTPACR